MFRFFKIFVCMFVMVLPFVAKAQIGFDAVTIYRQARLKNYKFLDYISEYSDLIDTTNRFGDTAFCMAAKYNDISTAKLLRSYGADTKHDCVKRIKENKPLSGFSNRYQGVENKGKGVEYVKSSNAVWGWTLSAVAVAGGAAALGGGGGGGSSDEATSEVVMPSPGGDTGGTRGDDDTGETGNNNGDKNNDNNDNNDNTDVTTPEEGGAGGNVGGESDEGTRGDDNTNTEEEGNNTGGSVGPNTSNFTPSVKNDFKTEEYDKGNFLDDINAAGAYVHIYSKDENGKLVSHQANSDESLKKVKVGIIDSGVFHNKEISDKIVSEYDLNGYNSARNVRVYTEGNIHFYVIENDNKYYLLPVNTIGLSVYGLGEAVYDNVEDLKNALSLYYRLDLKDFVVINNGKGNPGSPNNLVENDVNTWWAYIERLSHGTHVAGVIAGKKDGNGMHGVAYENAEIVTGSWDLGSSMYATVSNMVDEGVSVLNNSWGNNVNETVNAANPNWLYANETDFLYSYAYAAQNNAVWVQATGNDSKSEADVHNAVGGMNLSFYGFNGADKYEVPYLAVTALDKRTADETAPSGKIANYANYCGSAKGWCLAAPGSNVISSDASTDGLTSMSGTSMATPVVSGSIALLQGYYPWLNAQNIAYILLETANSSGEYANSNIYGQGALDLEAAVTTPIDGLNFAEKGDLNSLKSVSSSKLSTSGVLQNKILKSMPKTITAYDALKRPFEYETSKLVNTTHGSSANLKNSVSRMAMGSQGSKVIKDEKSGFQFSSSESLDETGMAQLSSMEVVHETEEGGNRFYYAKNSKYMTSKEVLSKDVNPYLAMREAYGAESSLKLSESSKLKFSLQSGLNGFYERDEEQDGYGFDERSYSLGSEYSFNMSDYLELSALGGMLYEEDAMLGLNGVGGFGIGNSSTYYMGLKAKLDLTNNVSLMAAYYRGYTGGVDSEMLSVSDLETESFLLAGEYQLDRRNKIGLMLSSPMSVVKGNAMFRYSSGRDNNSDTAYMKELKTSLRPEAKEYDFGMYYQGEPTEKLSLSGKLETRINADGEKGVNDYIGVIGAHYNF